MVRHGEAWRGPTKIGEWKKKVERAADPRQRINASAAPSWTEARHDDDVDNHDHKQPCRARKTAFVCQTRTVCLAQLSFEWSPCDDVRRHVCKRKAVVPAGHWRSHDAESHLDALEACSGRDMERACALGAELALKRCDDAAAIKALVMPCDALSDHSHAQNLMIFPRGLAR